MPLTDYVKYLDVSQNDIDNIRIPEKVKSTVHNTTVEFASSTVSFIFGAIFIVVIIIIWLLVPFGVLKWVYAVILTVIVAVVLLCSSMYYSSHLDSILKQNLDNLDKNLAGLTQSALESYGVKITSGKQHINVDDIEF